MNDGRPYPNLSDPAISTRGRGVLALLVAYDGVPEWLPECGNTGAVRLPIRYTVVQ